MNGASIKRSVAALFGGMGALACLATPAAAGDAGGGADSGNIAWVLVSSALVLFMTLPGLALFYGGLVRARNVLSVLMHCFAICCLVSVLWIAFGYSLAFDAGGAFLGTFDRLFLAGLAERTTSTGLPENVFALFQMTFAIITPALIIGAFTERVPFPFVLLFSGLWLILVYVPVAHWVWGGGWLAGKGVLDFAGGIVVHTTAGITALVSAIMIGKRRGFPRELPLPHSPMLTMAGAGMLWVGWFGFNGGSALAASAGAGSAIIATHAAASAGAVTWIVMEWFKSGKPTSIGIATGCVAGLATVTPASGYIGPGAALALGALAGVVCFTVTVFVKTKLLIDDSLDVFAVHGVGGMLGSLLLSVLALREFGGAGLAEGMGWIDQLGVQVLAVGITALWSALVTVVIILALRAVTGLRVEAEGEVEGLDITVHGERGYDFS